MPFFIIDSFPLNYDTYILFKIIIFDNAKLYSQRKGINR